MNTIAVWFEIFWMIKIVIAVDYNSLASVFCILGTQLKLVGIGGDGEGESGKEEVFH